MFTRDGVTLRAVERNDMAVVHQYANDLGVELAGGGDPPMPQTFSQVQAEYDREFADGGRSLNFAIEYEGVCIGRCGLFRSNRTARTISLGVGIGVKELWGRGIGKTAVSMMVEIAFWHHNYRKVWLEVQANNPRAIRCYEACGFVEEGRLRAHIWAQGEYHDLILMGLMESDWRASRQATSTLG